MEVSGYDSRKIVWELADDHVVEELKENDEIGLLGYVTIGQIVT